MGPWAGVAVTGLYCDVAVDALSTKDRVADVTWSRKFGASVREHQGERFSCLLTEMLFTAAGSLWLNSPKPAPESTEFERSEAGANRFTTLFLGHIGLQLHRPQPQMELRSARHA